jgi:hypothetical protein
MSIVHDDAVAVLQSISAELADCARDAVNERSQVRGLREALGDHPAPGVEDRAGKVAAGLDVRRERGSLERAAHLVRDGEDGVLQEMAFFRTSSVIGSVRVSSVTRALLAAQD